MIATRAAASYGPRVAEAKPAETADARPRALWARWPYALLLGLYLLTSPYHQGLNNPNEMVRVYMTKAWVESGRFRIDSVIRQWGLVDDKAIRDGHLYSSKAPLQSLVGIPAYAAAPTILAALGSPITKRTLTWVLRVLGAATFGIGFCFVLLRWCRRRSVELGASAAYGNALGLGLGLGTMVYPYSITFTGHGLAAVAAGGCYLAVMDLSRRRPGGRGWTLSALIAGALGGAAPFAEYPSALVAAPALAAAFVMTPGGTNRARLFGWFALGGAAPFGLGLWAHHALWGHPFATGYGFLENRAYVEVHGEGFFGVSVPRGDAFVGALVSPGTGLFFFSPLLLAGLAAVVFAAGRPRRFEAADPRAAPAAIFARPLAVAALVGFVLSVYFISAHRGWRGGWTVGPRYIVGVAPVLGLWAVEALRVPPWRPLVAGLAGASIALTGFAASLYPHLSDVYSNPLGTFLWPSYRAGATTYGLGHTLGLDGAAANAVHVGPLVLAIGYCIFVGLADRPLRRRPPDHRPRRWWAIAALFPLGVAILVVAVFPERNPAAAYRENQRLWGFWEPEGPPLARPAALKPRSDQLFRARRHYRRIRIEARAPNGQARACGPFQGPFCHYGVQPWQRFGPERIPIGGAPQDVLFLHPIAGHTVRATIPVVPTATSFILRYGMADASVGADNPHPIALTVRQGDTVLSTVDVPLGYGLRSLEGTLTSTAPLRVELEVDRDGARVFGFDLEQYR